MKKINYNIKIATDILTFKCYDILLDDNTNIGSINRNIFRDDKIQLYVRMSNLKTNRKYYNYFHNLIKLCQLGIKLHNLNEKFDILESNIKYSIGIEEIKKYIRVENLKKLLR